MRRWLCYNVDPIRDLQMNMDISFLISKCKKIITRNETVTDHCLNTAPFISIEEWLEYYEDS
jgi:hypothetical protein